MPAVTSHDVDERGAFEKTCQRISSFEKNPASPDGPRWLASDQHGAVGDWDLVLERTHLAHVLLARQSMESRARAEDTAALKERVRVQVEYATQ